MVEVPEPRLPESRRPQRDGLGLARGQLRRRRFRNREDRVPRGFVGHTVADAPSHACCDVFRTTTETAIEAVLADRSGSASTATRSMNTFGVTSNRTAGRYRHRVPIAGTPARKHLLVERVVHFHDEAVRRAVM